MASVTKYPSNVSQTTGGKFVSFSNLANIKNNADGAHAVSSVLIKSKKQSPNRPSTVSCKGFGFSLPEGAEPTKITVTYRHRKNAGSDYSSKNKTHICNIGGPTISLLGVSGFSSKGSGCTTTMTTHTKAFSVHGKLSRAQVNSANFGVKLDYPTNSNTYNGYMRISYVRVTVEYITSQYSVSVKHVSGTYEDEDYVVSLGISNKNLTSYNPTCTLTVPAGFTYKGVTGAATGTVTKVNNRTFSWNPQLQGRAGSRQISLAFEPNVTFPEGTDSYSGTFRLSESLNGANSSLNAVISKRPAPSGSETAGESTQVLENEDTLSGNDSYLILNVGEEFLFSVEFTDAENAVYNRIGNGEDDWGRIALTLFKLVDGSWIGRSHYDVSTQLEYDESIPEEVALAEGDKWSLNKTLSIGQVGTYRFSLRYENEHNHELDYDMRQFLAYVRPSEEQLGNPCFTVLRLSDEECDRLGSLHTYIAQAYMKHITDDTHPRDWYRNLRLGVFNNAIADNITVTSEEVDGEIIETVEDSTDYESLTNEDIFNNAEYWSDALANVNEFDNLECEFTYNEDYPLCIIMTGDYNEADGYDYDVGTVEYTNPCIVEKDVYKQREPSGNYPIPLENVLSNDDSSELGIEQFNISTPIILYTLPFDEGYGTNEEMTIRGIEVSGTLEQSDELTVNAKLKSPTGISGTRSIIIEENDLTLDSTNEFRIGGFGDLWGFSTFDLTNLDDFELELTVNNNIHDTEANINFQDVKITFYLEFIQDQKINIKINEEDLSFYGVFTDDVIIPEGLETDTSFLTIDGTDTNDAYRQNIKEKEIELILYIAECDFQSSTDMLRQLSKVLVNERDDYNRPIPNRIEFSHYPDVYFEYVMESALSVESDISTYNIKAKLTIPSGTAFSKKTYSTGVDGYVQGIAPVNPVITFKPQSDTVEILERKSGQRFNMTYTAGWETMIAEIDCESHTVVLKTDEDDSEMTDISGACDFNVDWFSLHGEYQFEGTGCNIRTVSYNERW
ncbi:phage-related protein [Methanobrevibacter ruminantium M1]|uniref:Phage-related protein n=1 Tax=Methanobrevibacter ruminantium (strain ATCC 35063 / DSM 1093 / JCM 13430 / OCM 146 / M1) TaxID=634498 RepID=D3DZZ2_METRM|nr:hypothetical protein [Methanobrevibacter ruminantium]ADC46168.1 phage-related protein [Methanobrevibacter ruminantium M1]